MEERDLKKTNLVIFFSRWRPSSCVCLASLLRSHPQVMDRVVFLLVKDLGRKVSCTIWGGSRLWRLRKIEFDRSALVYRSRLRSRYKKQALSLHRYGYNIRSNG